MRARPDWQTDGLDWPHRDHSRFVLAAGLRWHLQEMGQGPVLLLIHGTGAASHSWRGLAPLLAERYRVIIPDLPGHGFTDLDDSRRLSLPRMADSLTRLLSALDVAPAVVVGHSAGAAIALRMALDQAIAPSALIAVNGALKPFTGLEGALFPILAKLLFLNPLAPSLLAWRASDPVAVARVIRGTGSELDDAGVDLYVRLLRSTRHVGATLGMMAHWDLLPLQRDLPRLSLPVTFLAGQRDRAVPPQIAIDSAARLAHGKAILLPDRGHLMHEERPADIAALIIKACTS